jgi:hypothetical protein
MPLIFEALPGLEVPVGAIAKSLAEMWSGPAVGGDAPVLNDDAKATQVNFVLHLGFKTTPEDALVQFRTAVRFSQRCPSRIVVLCPMVRESGEKNMRAKIYGECHLGKSKDDKRCVEFVMLNYPRARGCIWRTRCPSASRAISRFITGCTGSATARVSPTTAIS